MAVFVSVRHGLSTQPRSSMNPRFSCFTSQVLGLQVLFHYELVISAYCSHTEHHSWKGLCEVAHLWCQQPKKRCMGTKKLPSKSGACDPRPPIRPHLSIPSNFKSINGLIHWVSAPLWCTKCRPMQEPLEGTEGAEIQRRPFMLLLAVWSRGPKPDPPTGLAMLSS